MKVVFDIKEAAKNLSAESVVQYKYGLSEMPYWKKVESGELESRSLSGKISRVFEDDLDGCPYIEVTDLAGEKTEWQRRANRTSDEGLYVFGREIRITYCVEEKEHEYTQRPWSRKCVLQIAVQE
ncbi:MAG: hypothetical protein AB2689_20570 [Candidatus Thiodiazotropha taylori]